MVTSRANVYVYVMGEWYYYNTALEVFTQRNLVVDFIRLKLNFIF